jgi:hypothetical protein
MTCRSATTPTRACASGLNKALTQAGSYVANANGSEKARADVIDEAMQVCRMMYIDGAWL